MAKKGSDSSGSDSDKGSHNSPRSTEMYGAGPVEGAGSVNGGRWSPGINVSTSARDPSMGPGTAAGSMKGVKMYKEGGGR